MRLSSSIEGYISHLKLSIKRVESQGNDSKREAELKRELARVNAYKEKNPEKVKRQSLIDKKKDSKVREARVAKIQAKKAEEKKSKETKLKSLSARGSRGGGGGGVHKFGKGAMRRAVSQKIGKEIM